MFKQPPAYDSFSDKKTQPKTKQIPWGSANNPLAENEDEDTIKKLWDQLSSRGKTINDILYGDLRNIFSETGLQKLEDKFQCSRSQLHQKLIDYLNSMQLNELDGKQFKEDFVFEIDTLGDLIIQNTLTGESKTVYGEDAFNLLAMIEEDESKQQEILRNYFEMEKGS
jgi:hypothetical protein